MAKTPKKSTWSDRAKREMLERETLTDIAGESDLTVSEESYFDVLEVKPDRSNDSEKYLLSGSPDSLATQTSLLLALKKMIGGESRIDFDRWLNNFEDGFPNWTNKSTRLSNSAKPWGKERDARPRLVKLQSSKETDYYLVEFFPNRDNLSESYLISGSQSQIIQQINLLWGFLGHLQQYDWGAIVGYPIAEYMRQTPTDGIVLEIRLACFKEPPFYRTQFGADGFEYMIQPRQVRIPMPKKEMLSYEAIRNACGGSSGLDWGCWSARAYISPKPGVSSFKGLSQMVAGGKTKEIADKNLDKFLTLTEGHAVGRTCTITDLQAGTRGLDPRSPYLKKYEVYPAWCFVKNSDLVTADDLKHKGKPTLSGKLVSKENKLFLWEPKEPQGWADTMRDMTRSPLRS